MKSNRPRILEWKVVYSRIRGLFVDGLFARRMSVADNIEEELDESLPCGGDMISVEKLRTLFSRAHNGAGL